MSYTDGRGPAHENPIWLEAEDNLDQICKKMAVESRKSEKNSSRCSGLQIPEVALTTGERYGVLHRRRQE